MYYTNIKMFLVPVFHGCLVAVLQVFLMPGYSAAAHDTTILLNARPIMTSLSGETRKTSKERTKIYICTTMYREVHALDD